jgi:hypothetical protein
MKDKTYSTVLKGRSSACRSVLIQNANTVLQIRKERERDREGKRAMCNGRLQEGVYHQTSFPALGQEIFRASVTIAVNTTEISTCYFLSSLRHYIR